MIPVGDVIPRRTRPLVTITALALLGGALLAVYLVLAPAARVAWLQTLGAHRDTFPWPSIATAWWFEPLWLTGMANLTALLLFGPAVEDRLGAWRMLTLLTAGAALSTALAASLASEAMPAAGAAGVAATVVAAHLSLFPSSRLVFWAPGPGGGYFWEVPAVWGLAAWTVIVIGELGRGVQPGVPAAIPLWSSAVGLALGATLVRVLARPERLAIAWWDRTAASSSTESRGQGVRTR